MKESEENGRNKEIANFLTCFRDIRENNIWKEIEK